jgi:hypothetical protein
MINFIAKAAEFALGLARALVEGDLDWIVENVIEPLVEALEAIVQFMIDLISQVIDILVRPFVQPILDAYDGWMALMAQLVMSFPTISLGDFVQGIIQLTFFSVFALAIFSIIVAFSVAEKITNTMTLGFANLAGFVVGALTGLIIGLLVVSAINEWLGSQFLEDLLPPGFDVITGASFTIAQFAVAYGLAVRPLKPIQSVETALKDSIVALLAMGVALSIEATFGESIPALIAIVVVDAIALTHALFGLRDMLRITGRGWNLVRMWYPFLYPVTVALNAISIATAASELVADSGRLNQQFSSG